MKNKEKFAKEIVEIACSGEVLAVSSGIIHKCAELPCQKCSFNIDGIECDEIRKTWAESEYVEPKYEIDWASVPVDTPVLIKGAMDNRKYFSRLLPDERLAVFRDGRTSWSSHGIAKEVALHKSVVDLARETDKPKYRKQVE
ncbi:MAG: hypothetical protein MR435_03220 [Coprococcus catus]|nr:hypothetical protein [Coprococcus catus]